MKSSIVDSTPMAHWVSQLPEVSQELVNEAALFDANAAEAEVMIRNIEAKLLRQKESLLSTVTAVWTAEQVAVAKAAIEANHQPIPGVTIGGEGENFLSAVSLG